MGQSHPKLTPKPPPSHLLTICIAQGQVRVPFANEARVRLRRVGLPRLGPGRAKKWRDSDQSEHLEGSKAKAL